MMLSRKTSVALLLVLVAVAIFALWRRVRESAPGQDTPILESTDETNVSAHAPPARPTRVSAGPALPTNPGASAAAFTPLTEKEIAQARQEIRIHLSALYAAEKSFYSEFHRYSTDLSEGLGFRPQADQGLWSKVGFLAPYVPTQIAGREDPRFLSSDDFARQPSSKFPYRPNAESVSLAELNGYCEAGCTADEHHFEILAATRFRDGAKPEVWVIDEKKRLRQLQDGTSAAERP